MHQKEEGTFHASLHSLLKTIARNIKTLIDETIALWRCVGRKDPDLAVVYFSNGAAILPCNTDGVVTLFSKTALIKNQSSIRMPDIIINKTTILN